MATPLKKTSKSGPDYLKPTSIHALYDGIEGLEVSEELANLCAFCPGHRLSHGHLLPSPCRPGDEEFEPEDEDFGDEEEAEDEEEEEEYVDEEEDFDAPARKSSTHNKRKVRGESRLLLAPGWKTTGHFLMSYQR